MSKKFSPEYLTMNDLFKRESIYCIPINQRKYSWKKDQYEEYWNDIISVLDDVEKRHYLGVITLVKKEKVGIRPDEYEVIDGQQRLITTLVFIAALRDVYVKINDTEKAKKIHKTYLIFETARDSYESVKSSKIDDFTLKSLVNIDCGMIDEIDLDDINFRSVDIDPSEFVNSNMIEAYKFFCKNILAGFEKNNKDKEYLIEIEELLSKIEIITVVSDDISNIFLYFDSLNNRGLQLNQMDIIRNKFFNIIKKNYSDYMELFGECWDDLVTILDGYDCVKFLKYFYMCEENNIFSSKELPEKYEIMFNKIVTLENMKSMVNKMIQYAQIYVKLFSKEQRNDKEYSYIRKINFLGQQACYSFAMDYFYYVQDVDRRVEILKNLLVMNYKRIICNSSTKQLDGIFKNLISKKNSDGQYNDTDIVKLILSNTPSDEALEKELKTRIWDKDNITLYTLYLLNSGQVKFEEIEKKQIYKVEFIPLTSRMSKDIYSCILVESKFTKEIRNIKEIGLATELISTKYTIEQYDKDKKELVEKIIDTVLAKV